MDWLANITFDQIGISFLAVFAIRQAVIVFSPNDVAGPGGWLIDTDCPDYEM